MSESETLEEGSFSFRLPDSLHFELSKDYASYCKHTIVRIEQASSPSDDFRVVWSRRELAFEHKGVREIFDITRVYRLCVDLHEQVLGQTLCTLRVWFYGLDIKGAKLGSLPVISGDSGTADELFQIGLALRESGLSIGVELRPFEDWGPGAADGQTRGAPA